MHEAIALGVVGALLDDRRDQSRQVLGVHLVIAGHDHEHVSAVRQRVRVAGDERRSHATAQVVPETADPSFTQAAHEVRRGVRAAVIDDDYAIHPVGNSAQGPADQRLLVVSRHDDGDFGAPPHARSRVVQGARCRKPGVRSRWRCRPTEPYE